MTEQLRGKNRSLVGASLQMVFTIVMLIVWLSSQSRTAFATMWLLLGGVLGWLMVALWFYVRQRAAQEQQELDEIAAGGDREGLFGADGETPPAAARLRLIEKWIVPAFTLVWSAYHVGVAVLIVGFLRRPVADALGAPAQWALILLPVAFAAFLYSRYIVGMSQMPAWRLLRAPGSYVFLNVLAVFAVVGVLLAAYRGYDRVDGVVAWAIPVLQFLLAAELLINLVLDVYRPRVPGQEHRPPFDSRVLNLVADPSRVGHTVADTLNYQFGFDVSRTWFYGMLSRAIVPLLVLGAVILLAMSSLVIVPEGDSAVVRRWGRVDHNRQPLGAGLHAKLPWPVERVDRFQTGRVHEILLGVGEQRAPIVVNNRELQLWTQDHGHREERNFLIAQPVQTRGDEQRQDTLPVNVIKLVAQVHYQIEDVYAYGYSVTDAHRTLMSIAEAEMTRYLASATLTERIDDPERPQALMTFGRPAAAARLRERIQTAANEYGGTGLGVNVSYVGFLTVHPPAQAAEAYQEVLDAQLRQEETRYLAQATAHQILSQVAGEPTTALRLALSVRMEQELRRLVWLAENDPSRFDAELAAFTAESREEVRSLDEMVQRDRLLGKGVTEAYMTANQVLLRAHREYLGQLESFAAASGEQRMAGLLAGLDAAQAQAQRLLDAATGEAAQIVARARAARWNEALREEATAMAFHREHLAYRASPELYVLDSYLDVLERVLGQIPNKRVHAVPDGRVDVWMDMREAGGGGLPGFGPGE